MKKIILSLILIGSVSLLTGCATGCGGGCGYAYVQTSCCNACTTCGYGYGYNDWY